MSDCPAIEREIALGSSDPVSRAPRFAGRDFFLISASLVTIGGLSLSTTRSNSSFGTLATRTAAGVSKALLHARLGAVKWCGCPHHLGVPSVPNVPTTSSSAWRANEARASVLFDHATELRMRAEIRAGELLHEMEKYKAVHRPLLVLNLKTAVR